MANDLEDDARAGAFAQIAARRKNLEDRRGRLTAQIAWAKPNGVVLEAEGSADVTAAQALADVRRVADIPIGTRQREESRGVNGDWAGCVSERRGGRQLPH